jgi:hypothetical protein
LMKSNPETVKIVKTENQAGAKINKFNDFAILT